MRLATRERIGWNQGIVRSFCVSWTAGHIETGDGDRAGAERDDEVEIGEYKESVVAEDAVT